MTTNNHPAHGPVSLDRLHQIRQYIEHNTQYSNGGNRAYILADVLKVIDGAIAAFGADPISQCDSRKQFEEHFGDGATPGMERVPPFFVEMMKDAFWTVWEDSRASMLQAGNHNEQHLDMVDCRLPFAQWLSQQNEPIDVDCGCVSTEAFYHWLRVAYEAGNSPVTPDGYVLVPKKLTAENGAKRVLSGEFSETKFINCPECFGDDDCETCDGSGRIEITVPVSWTNIKAIWAKGVEHFAAAPQQENV
ncbi:hypothetical protein [Citrobacter portucalensis]|uniref:hypothetical protein n=1 Tax=Citrobacter portucalensis TaxID=1639133 RepID=UPI001F4196E6|nr:hypothetical protein [Citrobacter portucalensis]